MFPLALFASKLVNNSSRHVSEDSGKINILTFSKQNPSDRRIF